MPKASAAEKAAKRLEAQQKREARKQAKAEKKKAAEAEALGKESSSQLKDLDDQKQQHGEELKLGSKGHDYITRMPDDAITQIICMLSAVDVGCLISTCRRFNRSLAQARIPFLLSRFASRGCFGLCSNEGEVRRLLEDSLTAGGETKRLITKKSKKSKESDGDADEFVGFARFVEECVAGCCALSTGRKNDPIFLSPYIHGRICSVSPEHSLCRIGGDGSRSGPGGSGVASWGVGKRGQLGHRARGDKKDPTLILGGIGYGIRIVQVAAGGGLCRVAHSLLLTATGRVLAFGNGQYGQLGFGYSSGKQLPDYMQPKYIESLNGIRCVCVSAGELHSAAVSSDGDLYTWGDGFCGQLGHGDKRPVTSPKLVEKGGLEDECVSVVSAGCRHTLAVTEDGEVWSFGLGHFGVLGRSFTPFEYDADAAVLQVTGEVDEDGGFAGLRPVNAPAVPIVPNAAPTAQADDRPFDLAAHLDLIANLSLDDSSDQCIPTLIDSLKGITITSASAGHRHSLLLDADGGLYSCGSGKSGCLGHGDQESSMYPIRIQSIDHVMQMSAGVDISMAVTKAGEVFSWGKSERGRIGLGMISQIISSPKKVDLGGWKAIDVEAGFVHSLIAGLDGTVRTCGGVGVDGERDGVDTSNFNASSAVELGKPVMLKDFNVWHRRPEPKEEKLKQKRWTKYGKYELQGRSKMMSAVEKGYGKSY